VAVSHPLAAPVTAETSGCAFAIGPDGSVVTLGRKWLGAFTGRVGTPCSKLMTEAK
jgi:hypothetical protein